MSRLVMIDRRLSLPEAVVRASMLEAYRIPVATGGASHAGMHWFVLFAIGGVAIQVPEDVEDTARALLRPVDPCASCLEPYEWRWFWKRPFRQVLGALLLFVGLPMPFWLTSRALWAHEEDRSPSRPDGAVP